MAPTMLGFILYGYYTYSFSINIGGGACIHNFILNQKFRKNHFIGTSLIILDTLQHRSQICFPPPNIRMLCHASICAALYKLYRWKLNHGQNNMGYEMKCYWECLREYIGDLGNTLDAWWEHLENLIGIHWEHTKIQKTIPLLPKPKRKRKKLPWEFLLPAWNLISKTSHHHFQPWLIPPL